MSARIGVKLLGGLLEGALEQNGDFAKKPNMSARIGLKFLGGLLGACFGAKRRFCEEAKHVSQDWGTLAFGGCFRAKCTSTNEGSMEANFSQGHCRLHGFRGRSLRAASDSGQPGKTSHHSAKGCCQASLFKVVVSAIE